MRVADRGVSLDAVDRTRRLGSAARRRAADRGAPCFSTCSTVGGRFTSGA